MKVAVVSTSTVLSIEMQPPCSSTIDLVILSLRPAHGHGANMLSIDSKQWREDICEILLPDPASTVVDFYNEDLYRAYNRAVDFVNREDLY